MASSFKVTPAVAAQMIGVERMQEVHMVLDTKEKEIKAWYDETQQERAALMTRLSEIDNGLRDAELDLERIARARIALQAGGNDETLNVVPPLAPNNEPLVPRSSWKGSL